MFIQEFLPTDLHEFSLQIADIKKKAKIPKEELEDVDWWSRFYASIDDLEEQVDNELKKLFRLVFTLYFILLNMFTQWLLIKSDTIRLCQLKICWHIIGSWNSLNEVLSQRQLDNVLPLAHWSDWSASRLQQE